MVIEWSCHYYDCLIVNSLINWTSLLLMAPIKPEAQRFSWHYQ